MFKDRTEKAKEKLIDPDTSDDDSVIPCEGLFSRMAALFCRVVEQTPPVPTETGVTQVWCCVIAFFISRLKVSSGANLCSLISHTH